jgi:hypothetical protein
MALEERLNCFSLQKKIVFIVFIKVTILLMSKVKINTERYKGKVKISSKSHNL